MCHYQLLINLVLSCQDKSKEIAPTLSDLVNYIKAKKFVSFQHSQSYQKFYENNSVSERKAQRLVRHSGILGETTKGLWSLKSPLCDVPDNQVNLYVIMLLWAAMRLLPINSLPAVFGVL